MGLIINQGVHQDDRPIESEEIAQITKVTPAKADIRPNSINVELTIISDGKYKGRKLFDLVPYDPDDPMAFKYKELRRAAKVPYDKNEGTKVDIEKLLLKKAVGVKLSVREYEGRDFQNIKYTAIKDSEKPTPITKEAPKDEAPEEKAPATEPTAKEETKAAEEKPAKANQPIPEISDDDFPF